MPNNQKKTFNEIYKTILAVLPNAQITEDNCGQLVVYTNQYPDVTSPRGIYTDFENLSKGQKLVIEDSGHWQEVNNVE
jgi:hypothetical protein